MAHLVLLATMAVLFVASLRAIVWMAERLIELRREWREKGVR